MHLRGALAFEMDLFPPCSYPKLVPFVPHRDFIHVHLETEC